MAGPQSPTTGSGGPASGPQTANGTPAAAPAKRGPKITPRTVKPPEAAAPIGPGPRVKTDEEILEARRAQTEPARAKRMAQAQERAARRETGEADPAYIRQVVKLHKRAAKMTNVHEWELDKDDAADAAEAWDYVFEQLEWRPAPGASRMLDTLLSLVTIYWPIMVATFLHYFGNSGETAKPRGVAPPAAAQARTSPAPSAPPPLRGVPMPAKPHAPSSGHFPAEAPAGTVPSAAPGAPSHVVTGGSSFVTGIMPVTSSPAPSTMSERLDEP